MPCSIKRSPTIIRAKKSQSQFVVRQERIKQIRKIVVNNNMFFCFILPLQFPLCHYRDISPTKWMLWERTKLKNYLYLSSRRGNFKLFTHSTFQLFNSIKTHVTRPKVYVCSTQIPRPSCNLTKRVTRRINSDLQSYSCHPSQISTCVAPQHPKKSHLL